MVRVCVFPNCSNKMTRWTPMSFHRLPFHDLALLKLWLVVLKLDPNSSVEALRRADHRVCSTHFAVDDFFPQKPRTEKEENKRQRIHLMKHAVPRVAAGTADTKEDGASGDVFLPVTDSVSKPRSSPVKRQHRADEWPSGSLTLIITGPPQTTTSRSGKSSSGKYIALAPTWSRQSKLMPSKPTPTVITALPYASASSPLLQVPEVPDTKPMEAVSESGTSMSSGDPELIQRASHRLPGDEKKLTKEEIKHEDTEAGSKALSSSSAEDTVAKVLVQGVKPESLPDSEKKAAVVKTEEEFELKDEKEGVKEENLEESPARADTSKELNAENWKVLAEKDKANEDMDTQEDERPHSSSLRVSTVDDLDEMMDIGTVDQVEQEAQMKEEEGNNLDSVSRAASLEDDNNSEEEETDVKPTVEQVEDVKAAIESMQSTSSPSSVATASTGRDSSSPATVMNGMKVVKISTQNSESEQSCSTQPTQTSPSPPLVKVKDEPVDEEYEQAQISSTSTASVKDEPNTAKEDLMIDSVYTVPPPAETQTLPVINPPSALMHCSNCKKPLTKGQTAFQKKGNPSLFCSTACLTTSLPTSRANTKVCHNCQKLIVRPQDVILAPDTKGAMKEFCSQSCLTAFNFKKTPTNFRIFPNNRETTPTAAQQSLCSMCTRFCVSKHEVILSGSLHKICSDACFNRFRTVNNLSMAGCANCGSYCHNKPIMLKLEDANKTLCNQECLAKYKEKTKITQPCTMCRMTRLISEMVDNKNKDDSVNLFCSSSCVMAYKVQTVSASGSRLNCDNCGKNTVPAYHLAMSDTSIRNFCTLPCVMAFQEKFKKSQKQVNVFTKLPIGSAHIQAPEPPQPQEDVSRVKQILSCNHCNRMINFKPELIQIKDKLVFVCSVDCSHEFKKANFVTGFCEYCKIEKITRDAKKINSKICFFCSDGCKLLFRHDLAKAWGKHCGSCVYCHSMSKKLVTAQYGGSTEEFCSEECRSKYTMLFCHVAKCDTCGRKGKLKQSLSMHGEVKHYCDLACLLKFCCDYVAKQEEDTPVIANVMSLAGPLSANSSKASNSKNTGNVPISTQTEKVKATLPPAPKILKNKALLCKPLVQNKGISCKTQTTDAEAQTDDLFPKLMVVPVPVPVFVPVPMNMYSQFTPKPVGLPLPLPVPMFLPVTMDSAERIVETIQEIKEKIPSDPFEAELILMAEMVAEDTEKDDDNKEEEERPKEKVAEKGRERQEAPAAEDHTSNYSDDLDTEDLANFLNNWEDASSDAGLRSPSRPYANEKLNPILDIPVGMPSEPYSEPPPQGPPPLDIEADFTVETLERMAHLREAAQRSPSPTPATSRRRQAQRKVREKRGRKPQRATKAAEAASKKGLNKAMGVDIPKLKSQYGVEAWKRWIQWRQTQPNLEKPRFGSRPIELKEDVLRSTTAELSYGLCCFIREVKRPNGERYSPDSIFYLCLGIQQYLFENGRVENIFMDRFYNKFSTEFTTMLRGFKPSITANGYIHSRVEEEFLWGCKQLGAYSPIVLLNTLLFFCCKFFGFTTVEQHHQLSFAHVMRCTKTNPDNTKTTFLRFYPPISINEAESDVEVPPKKRKEEESKEDILEMMENAENPLRCPVRLYEFYLSKCSESVKQRTNLFYLHPERCCVPNSPLWFSSIPLDDSTMEAMLTRILTVRELHLRTRKAKSDDPPYIPDEEEGDSE
ncbi:zinc finger MYM-type protein 4 isoform X3 [Halichoeres trimaculatus]|uniref:zinc finger MYM-type protein 4 isoform X3 n=1 Tax=Halichoeres trimaculatus TaxID=147232 RepID=UPI003D9EC7DD